MAKFLFRGLKEKYNVDVHGEGFFLTTDTHEIIVKGESYGASAETIAKIDAFIASKGQPEGLATLGADGKVPVSQLSGQIANVVELQKFVDTKIDLDTVIAVEGDEFFVIADSLIYTKGATTWNAGKAPLTDTIYVHILANKEGNTNVIYRWGGTQMVEISSSLVIGEIAGTAYDGARGKKNADAILTLDAKVGSERTADTDPTGLFKALEDDEKVIAAALNDLNDRVGVDSVITQIDAAITDLKGGVSTEYDTLKKIENLLKKGNVDTLASAKSYTDIALTWEEVI